MKKKPARKVAKRIKKAPEIIDRRLHHRKPAWVDYAFSAPGLCFGILYAMLTIMLVWLAR